MNFSYDYPKRHAITVDEFMRMGEAHVFGYEARLELIEGEILEMAPISSAHASVVCRLDTLLRKAAAPAMVSVQRPLVLSERSAPQPDVMLLRQRADQYYNSHPVAEDALLVVEVADTTVEYDFVVKRPLYARAGVAEFWVVDINQHELHVFRAPKPDSFVHRILTSHDDSVIEALEEAILNSAATAANPMRGRASDT